MIVAVCGGIGSGKSAVTAVLRSLGAYTLSADAINAELFEKPDYLIKLAELFPEAFRGGCADKRKIREIIFGDEKRRKALNALAHGEIMSEIARRSAGKETVFVEVPLLGELKNAELFDRICFVRAPRDVRVERIIARDGVSAEQAESALEIQRGEEELEKTADFVIDNTSGLEELGEAVKKMYAECLKK